MKIKVEIIITGCENQCPYYGVEQGGVMYCSHSDAPNSGYIISRPEIENRIENFPILCPIIHK